MDDLGLHVADVLGLAQRTAEIHPVERQDDVSLAHELARFLDDRVERLGVVVRIVAREHRALLEIGEHAGAEPLGEADARLPILVPARSAAEQDDRLLRILEEGDRLIERVLRRARRLRRLEPVQVRPHRLLVELGLLEAGIKHDIDRRGRRGARDDIRARHRLHQRGGGGRLIVPLHERADVGAVVARRVNPVDPRTALLGSNRAGRTQHEHRRAVAPCIEDAHHAVQQSDVAVQDARHRLAGRLGVAMRDRDGMIFVQAENDAGILVAEMVNQAVVKSAIARPWVEADKGDVKTAQHLRGDVTAPSDLVVGLSFNPIQLHFFSLFPLCLMASVAAVIQRRRRQTTQSYVSSTHSAQPPACKPFASRWYATDGSVDDHASSRTAASIKETTFA